MSIGYKLQDINVNLDSLLLDPDNFRLDKDSKRVKTPDDKILDLQDETLGKLSKEQLSDLKNSIYENGFLEVDRVVVRKLDLKSTQTFYLVIEGNRRTAAFKQLIKEHKDGLINLDDETFFKAENINVVLVEGTEAEIQKYENILMGVRHVSGPKKWTGLQSAKLINEMFTFQNLNVTQIGAILGISPQETNRRRRAFLAFKQLENDKKYGSYVDPDKHYALLSEFTGKKVLLDWLAWDDEECITNQDAKKVVYNHILAINGKPEVYNPTLARELVKAIIIPRYEARLLSGELLSDLGPINSKPEDILKSFKSFYNLLKNIDSSDVVDDIRIYGDKIIASLERM
tara:strand:- start:866 stop:1897 length:1032 start_codon:yes stop_codon:yes gene_type:complete